MALMGQQQNNPLEDVAQTIWDHGLVYAFDRRTMVPDLKTALHVVKNTGERIGSGLIGRPIGRYPSTAPGKPVDRHGNPIDPVTKEPVTIPQQRGDDTMTSLSAATPTVTTDGSHPLDWLFRFMAPKSAQITEKGWRVSQTSVYNGQKRGYTDLREFRPPRDTSTNSLSAQGAAVAALDFLNPQALSAGDLDLLRDYVDRSRQSADPAIRAAAQQAHKSLSSIGYLHGIPRTRSSVVVNLLEPTRTAIQQLLQADRNGRNTGSIRAGQLSSNGGAVLSRILDTGGPQLMRYLRDSSHAVAPRLRQTAELMYVALQANGLQNAEGSGTWTRSARDAIRAYMRYAAESADPALALAAANAQTAFRGRTMRPGLPYTRQQFDALVRLMTADLESKWVGGSRIDPSLRGTLSPHGATLQHYLASAAWTRESASFAASYLKALARSPDPRLRQAAEGAAMALARARFHQILAKDPTLSETQAAQQVGSPMPQAGAIITQCDRQALTTLTEAEQASWWRPRMAPVDDHITFRTDRARARKRSGSV
jgi:hypothetical protein